MKKLKLFSLLPVMLFPLLIAGNAHAARPYSGFLPAVVNNKSGNIFWCDAYRQVRKLCTATEVDSMGWFIVVRSKPSRDCPGGIWGWITPSKDDVATGYTITPGKEFNLTMKDMCSPDMKVTFRPNKKNPRYDDLVGIYAGKEAFRYKQIK